VQRLDILDQRFLSICPQEEEDEAPYLPSPHQVRR
jgi:hypothetical protein